METLKKKQHAIFEILNQFRFGWDDIKKMIQCEKSIYIEWCKVSLVIFFIYAI